MTREDAINKVRQMSLPKETMDILEALAPELTMSEDEMMIYELQGFLSSFGSDYFGSGEWQKFDDWLEKQKEQKPAEWSKEDDKRVKQLIYDTEHIRAEYEERKELGDGFNNELIKDCDEQITWLKNLQERFNLQPKQEWSEEDTEMYINVASSLRGYACGLENEEHKKHIKKELDWLENRFKSLRPQQKVEWSEEDENIYNKALDALYYKDCNEKDDVIYALDNLCGLIYRKRKRIPKYARWKPSEEQMAMLLAVINEPNNAGAESCRLALKSLYEHLKKLM